MTMTVSAFISKEANKKKFFMALCLILAFALGTLVPIANAFEIPSFVKDIKIYNVTKNQVFLEIYGQVYVYDYLTED